MQKSDFGQKCHLRGFVPTATICYIRLQAISLTAAGFMLYAL